MYDLIGNKFVILTIKDFFPLEKNQPGTPLRGKEEKKRRGGGVGVVGGIGASLGQGCQRQKASIARGVRQQKGASPSKARCQILNILIIHIEHKSYVPSALKYYNESIFH